VKSSEMQPRGNEKGRGQREDGRHDR